MPIKIVPPFIVKSPSNGTKKKNMRTNGDNNEHKSLIQDRAKVIYEILVKGLKNNDGKIVFNFCIWSPLVIYSFLLYLFI